MAKTMTSKVGEYPPDRISVENGRVKDVWSNLDLAGEPWETIFITQYGPGQEKFCCQTNSPMAESSKKGTLLKVVATLSDDIQGQYMDLFRLEKADKEAIQKLGFKNHEVEELPS